MNEARPALSGHAHCCAAHAATPGRSAGSFSPPLFGLAPGGVYQASASRRSWWSLTPPFQLSRTEDGTGVNSKSISRSWGFLFCGTIPSPTSGPVAAGNHLALWSPDFPLRSLGAITQLAQGHGTISRRRIQANGQAQLLTLGESNQSQVVILRQAAEESAFSRAQKRIPHSRSE